MRILFLCSRNRLRSPTAERIFAGIAGIDTDSAGLAPDAELRLSGDQVEWADLVVVMDKSHRAALKRRFGRHLSGTKVVCLDIPDNYEYMQPELIALLESRMRPHLAGRQPRR